MDRLREKLNALISFLKEKKQYLFIAIPFGLTLLFIAIFIFQAASPQTTKDQEPTGSVTINTTPEEKTVMQGDGHEDSPIEEVWPEENFYGDADPSGLQDVQKVEGLPDGTKKYTSRSSNPDRPNILIAKDDKTIYQRSIPLRGADIPVQNFIELIGQPEAIIEGPEFYGKGNTNEYIYASKGIAVIFYNSNGQVIEQHYFTPTTTDQYIKKYSNDSY